MRLHRRIGEALEPQGDANPAALAYHFSEGRAPQAADYALAAAEQAAAALAYEEAAEHYRRAGDDVRDAARPRRGGAARRRPRVRASRSPPRFDRADDREAQAEAALGFAGRHAEAGVIDREGIDAARAGARALRRRRRVLAVQLRARLIDRLQFAEQRGRALELSAEALAIAHRLDDPRALLVALESRHAALMHVDHLEERLAPERGAARAGRADRRARAGGARPPLAHLRPARGRPRSRTRATRTARLATLAAELRQPLYHHFALGWEVVWAQMAGRVADAERLAREAYELGRRAHARDAESIYAAQTLILRRREDALQDFVGTIEGLRSPRNPALVAWRAILPMAHLLGGDTQAGVAEFRALAQDEFAAIPRDMFWFTAIALLGETCALIGDREQAPVLYRLLEPHARSSCRSRRPRTSARPTASSRC